MGNQLSNTSMNSQITIMEFFKLHLIEILLWFWILISPSFVTMGALLVIILCDFISGIWASVVCGGWVSITSRKMSRTVGKIILYYVAIIAGLACENLVANIPFTQIAVGFVAIVELKSVYENVGKITGVDIWVALKKYFDRKTENENGS